MVKKMVRKVIFVFGMMTFAGACGVKRPPTPIYATHPFESAATTGTATPSPTPTPTPQPTKKKSK